MDKEEITSKLVATGWKLAKAGNLMKTVVRTNGPALYRIKFQKLVVRFEILVEHEAEHGDGRSEWVRLASAYYKDVTEKDGGVVIGNRTI